ncbi:MAG: phosphate transport system substrate-binding protein [Thermoleophilaceae bacterium]|jgi:phosphate transport system substrate-binding protein|nr:phosphate transport system substrate-binding protein [Thermoleophilaceae bacterium]
MNLRTKENPLRSRTWLVAPLVLVLALAVSACGSSDNKSSTGSSSGGGSGTVNGAGSTFAAPIYSQWGNALGGKGITVNYQPVGSGAGIAQLAAGTADFGASDPALTPQDRATFKKGEVQQIPMAFGAITISYNLSGVKKGLKLDGKTAADIFLGKITKWNDPAIAKLNSGVKLPGDSITVVHRSDESGTTKGFTTFLAAYSPEWSSKVGADKTVKWPVGTGAKGNDGVAAAVKQQSGAVGYVEEAYALQNNFTTASVKNKSGKFVEPTLATTTAAGKGVKVPADLGLSVIDSPNPAAYPISSQTFVDVYKDLCKGGLDQGKAKAVKGFIDYGLGAGQSVLGQLQYAQLPAPLLKKAQAASDGLTCNGSPVKG